jgi:hypothetical protein
LCGATGQPALAKGLAVTERSSPLNQRLRRLLGTGSLNAPPMSAASDGRSRETDTGLLFESQITRLSQALIDLRAIDQQREAELCALRTQLNLAQDRVQAALSELETLIAALEAQLAPPGAATTLFERMRARNAATALGTDRRAELVAWLTTLKNLRTQLRVVAERES